MDNFMIHDISYITANFHRMCLMLDQFLWGHSSRDCDISCSVCLLRSALLIIKRSLCSKNTDAGSRQTIIL